MGIIKGSESTLGKPRRCLSREEYEDQTNRSLSGESTERARIYTLFEAYQKLRPPFSYDTADRYVCMNYPRARTDFIPLTGCKP